jgi:hypothetical protein
MKFGTRNVRSLFSVGAIKSEVEKLEKRKFDLVGVQEVRWEREGYQIRGPFAKFVDSPYYSESELCGRAETVSFRSTSLGKECASYNAPHTSRKCAADRLPQASESSGAGDFDLGAPSSRLEKPRNRMG